MTGSVAGLSPEAKGFPKKIMNSGRFHAKAKLFAVGLGILQFLARVILVFAADHRFRQINGTAQPVIFQVKSLGLLDHRP